MVISQNKFRIDIQGLRALAISLIIIFHVWPFLLTGGYIGVDVFFVISGFLISQHLLAEVRRSNSISLSKFWAKRIRRLLPASLFVLFASLLFTIVLMPRHIWAQAFREILASAFYVQNWVLVVDSVDYLAVENEPTLVQHFWSLSVEEQFYLIWPLLILSIVLSSKYINSKANLSESVLEAKREAAIKNGLLLVFIFSLCYSIYESNNSSALSYFSTATRAWEFSVGGLLLFIPKGVSWIPECWRDNLRVIVSWLGFALIGYSAVSFTADTIFPGFIALIPAIGTALIIVACGDNISWSFSAMARYAPIQFIGNVSYSAYLWHWPLVVLYPFIFVNLSSQAISGLIVVGITFVFAWFSKMWIEDPVLKNNFWIKKTSFAYIFAVTAAVLLTVLVGVSFEISKLNQPLLSESNQTFNSINELKIQLEKTLVLDSWPEADQKPGKHAWAPEWIIDSCNNIEINDLASIERCVYGVTNAEKTLVVLGDSWATHFLPAIREAFSPHWRIQVLTLSQCPLADVSVHKWGEKSEFARCKKHRVESIQWILRYKPDLIIASDSPISTQQRLMSNAEGDEALQEIKKGLLKTYKALHVAGITTLHIESPPRANCFAEKVAAPNICTSRQDTRFERSISEIKISVARQMSFSVLDTAFWLCSFDLICPNQIGSMLVKADSGHLTGNFSKKLGKVMLKNNGLAISKVHKDDVK